MRGSGGDEREPRAHEASRRESISKVPKRITGFRIWMGRSAAALTVVAWAAYVVQWTHSEFVADYGWSTRVRVEAVFYLVVVTLLTCSALAYLLSRLGFFSRSRRHQRVPQTVLGKFFQSFGKPPKLTILVPSYQEDARVIRATLLSAALQEFPGLRVVLLVDDPPQPRNERARRLLQDARALPEEISELLSQPAERFRKTLRHFEASAGSRPTLKDTARLAKQYVAAVNWLDELAAGLSVVDHADKFLVDEVIRNLADDFASVALELNDDLEAKRPVTRRRLLRLQRRLVWTFEAHITSFERKKYVSLSHEPNKAMNLNSYIGLMGGVFSEVSTQEGAALVPANPSTEGAFSVPEPDYVLTLDADSILLPEYGLRLIHLLEQPENRRVAVAQTPYSAFPGAATRLERIAGATTDVQHIVHQGLTHFGATFWVGANAVLRKRALNDIAVTEQVGEWSVKKYITDRTAIEDTESSIDMGIHGWQLVNYPERLAYSATPSDFGSLCIQRRRWANGGLLIIPKLVRQGRASRERGERTSVGEFFMRVNYMASTFWTTIALFFLLAYPFNNHLESPLVVAVALPYFFMMASDLRYCGYRRMDVLRIYGFNLVLVPVNLAGVTSSLRQGITGRKASFVRTPKVRTRTTPSFGFVVTPYLLVGLAGVIIWHDTLGGHWVNVGFVAFNALLASYAIGAFMGIRHSIEDVWAHVTTWAERPEKPIGARWNAPRQVAPIRTLDFNSILQASNAVSAWSAAAEATSRAG